MSLVSRIQSTFSKKDENGGGIRFSFIKDRPAILKALMKSQETGKLIGVYSRTLGDGMFLTGVDNIENVGETKVIVFETYDLCGQILNRTRVTLEEIKMVCPFEAAYINPLLGQLNGKVSSPIR